MRIRWTGAVPGALFALGLAPGLDGQAGPGPRVPVTGVVVDAAAGSGVPAAWVRLLGIGADRSSLEATTDRDGRFQLRTLPAGPYLLEVSALGYRSVSEAIEILGIGPTDLHIQIVPEALELDPIVVTTTSGGWLERTGFFERRETGLGTYFTREEVRRYAMGQTLSDVFRIVPGASVVPPGAFGETARVQFRGGCEPPVFVDGNPMIAGTALDEVLQAYDVEGLEVYRGIGVPARFAGRGSCGAFVVWTREPGRGVGTGSFVPSLVRALVGVGTILAAVAISF